MEKELITIITVLLVLFLIALLVQKGRTKSKNVKTNDKLEDDIGNIFFKKIRDGANRYLLLKIYSEFDLMFIKSLFRSESIPYYTEYEHLNCLKPGININNYNGVSFYILEEDYKDAMTVVDEYIKRKKLQFKETAKDKIRNITEFIVGGWYVNNSTTQQMVIYKKS